MSFSTFVAAIWNFTRIVLAPLEERVTLQIKVLFVRGDPGITDEHSRFWLEDGELSGFLLLLPFVMLSQYRFIHHTGE